MIFAAFNAYLTTTITWTRDNKQTYMNEREAQSKKTYKDERLYFLDCVYFQQTFTAHRFAAKVVLTKY